MIVAEEKQILRNVGPHERVVEEYDRGHRVLKCENLRCQGSASTEQALASIPCAFPKSRRR